jgi:large subunit ribosomal protein L18
VNHEKTIAKQRQRRRYRVRKTIRGDEQRPRLTIHRSHQHIYAQIIDDDGGRTLAAASSIEKDVRGGLKYGGNKDAAQAIGRLVAERALAAGVKQVKFDRREYKYHGRVAALAEAAREAGLSF